MVRENSVETLKGFIKMFIQIGRRLDYILLYLIYHTYTKIDSKQILMLSDSRESLSGNLWFIDARIPKNEYTVLYFFKKNLKQKRTWKEKKELSKAMAQSKFILLDDFYPLIYPIPITKRTKVIQVWHAMGAFKRVGFSRQGKPGGPFKFSLTHRNYTDTIVSSEDIRKNYAEAFKMSIEDVHAIGIPRTDVFFDDNYKNRIRTKLYEEYPQLKRKKVILFAPTFRGNGQNTAHYSYDWIDFEALEKRFCEEYIFIFKPHPFIKNRPIQKIDSNFFIDCSEYREINDLLFVTDILITDYSSVIFEAALLNIKTIFYIPDLQEYMESRDFYYPFEEYTFGQVATTNDELIKAIEHGVISRDRLNRFKKKFCSACDGYATKRFIETLLGIEVCDEKTDD